MNQPEKVTAEIPIARQIQDLARKALEVEYECLPSSADDNELREVLGPAAAEAWRTRKTAVPAEMASAKL